MKVFWFGYMEEVVCDRDELILNPLFNFEPVKGLEYRRDVNTFRNACYGTCKSVLNMLKALI